MSVEKTVINFEGEIIPYTQVYTHVMQTITNAEAYLVWSYLLSKPTDWEVIKEHIKKKYGYGNKKIKSIFSYLNKTKLIEYIQERENNQITRIRIKVLNGSKFNPNLATGSEIDSLGELLGQKATGSESNPVAKDTTTKNREKNKDKDKTHKYIVHAQNLSNRFDEFWNVYPRKQSKTEALKIWEREKLDDIADLLINHTVQRFEFEWQYKDKKFIPLPSTFLTGRRWEDEITPFNNQGVSANGTAHQSNNKSSRSRDLILQEERGLREYYANL